MIIISHKTGVFEEEPVDSEEQRARDRTLFREKTRRREIVRTVTAGARLGRNVSTIALNHEFQSVKIDVLMSMDEKRVKRTRKADSLYPE